MDAFDDFAPIDPNRPVPQPFVESAYQAAICNDAETGSDHVLVRARAGSGKTETIVRAIRRIPERHMGSVLLAAFNSKIADELRRRAPSTSDVMTLHSYGFRAVIRHLGGKPEVDKWKVHGMARELLGDAPGTAEIRGALQRAVAAAKNTLATTVDQIDALVDAMNIDLPIGTRRLEFASDVLSVLEQCKNPKGVIDFDDQVWLPVVLGLNTRKFDRVFIDETQDLNPTQIELAMAASRRGSRVTAVGDDRQSIYKFRGADEHAMDRVKHRLNAKILPLSVSYRCARSIVKLAQQTVPDIEAAPGAREGEVRFGVRIDTLYREAQPGDFILSRVNAPLLTMCLRFIREGRRATIQGRSIGDELAAFVRKIDCDRYTPAGVTVFRDYVDAWKATEVARLVAKERDTQAVEDKAACLHALADQAKNVTEIERAIANLFEDKDDATRIILSSTHRAKGMERERAWLIGDTFRPTRGIQEANLWYVGVTRAKGSLQIVSGVP